MSTVPYRLTPGSVDVDVDYTKLSLLGKGTFGEVHKSIHKPTGSVVALKALFLHNEKEGFPVTSLREIDILQNLYHPNIVDLIEIAVKRGDRAASRRFCAYMVMPYMEHDLAGLLENKSVRFTLPQIKYYMHEVLRGLAYIHSQRYLHRDMKAANILISNRGQVKIADFGLARRYFDAVPTITGAGERHSSRPYTYMVVTRWYRAPELILGDTHYTTAIDMWGLGCVFGEMFRRKPILQGKSDIDQGHCIFKLLGSPNDDNMPGFSKLIAGNEANFAGYPRTLEAMFHDLPREALLLLSGLLTLDPLARLSALGALDHSFFFSDPPMAQATDHPSYTDSHQMTVSKHRNSPDTKSVRKRPHVGNGNGPPYRDNSFPRRQYYNNNTHHMSGSAANSAAHPYRRRPPRAPPQQPNRRFQPRPYSDGLDL